MKISDSRAGQVQMTKGSSKKFKLFQLKFKSRHHTANDDYNAKFELFLEKQNSFNKFIFNNLISEALERDLNVFYIDTDDEEFGEMEKAEIEETPSHLPKKCGQYANASPIKSEPSNLMTSSTNLNNLHNKSKNINKKSYKSSTDKLINTHSQRGRPPSDTKGYKNKVNSTLPSTHILNSSSTTTRRTSQGSPPSPRTTDAIRTLIENRVTRAGAKRSIPLNDSEPIVGNLLLTVQTNQMKIKDSPNINIEAKNLPIKQPNLIESSRTRARSKSAASSSINEVHDKVGNEKFPIGGKRRRLNTNNNTSSLNGSSTNKTSLLNSNSDEVTNQKILVDVPSWREVPTKSYSSLSESQANDELLFDNETCAKKHAKLDIREKQSKRWDAQRQRELSYIEGRKQKQAEREAQKLKKKQWRRKISQDDEITSFNPEDAQFICFDRNIPVQFEGHQGKAFQSVL